MRAEIPALTGLRFFAAFFVMLAHAAAQSGAIPAGIYLAGFTIYATLGMVLFFTLSGFVLQYNYGSAIASGNTLINGKEVKRFAISRIARIYPLYLLFLAVMIAWQRPVEWNTTGGIMSVLLHLFSLQSVFFLDLGGAKMYPAYSVTWSISTEMFFYAMFPLLTIIVTRWLNGIVKVLAAMGLLIMFSLDYVAELIKLSANPLFHNILTWGYGFDAIGSLSFSGWLVHISPYERIMEFLLGMLTAQLFIQLQNKPLHRLERLAGTILTYVAVICSFGMLFAVYEPTHCILWGGGQSHFVLAPAVALVMFTVARYPSSIGRFLNSKWLVRLGNTSYSIYLLHIPIIWYLARYWTRFDSSYMFCVRVAVAGMVVIAVSFFTYEYFENPARRFVRRKLTTQSVMAVAEPVAVQQEQQEMQNEVIARQAI